MLNLIKLALITSAAIAATAASSQNMDTQCWPDSHGGMRCTSNGSGWGSAQPVQPPVTLDPYGSFMRGAEAGRQANMYDQQMGSMLRQQEMMMQREQALRQREQALQIQQQQAAREQAFQQAPEWQFITYVRSEEMNGEVLCYYSNSSKQVFSKGNVYQGSRIKAPKVEDCPVAVEISKLTGSVRRVQR